MTLLNKNKYVGKYLYIKKCFLLTASFKSFNITSFITCYSSASSVFMRSKVPMRFNRPNWPPHIWAFLMETYNDLSMWDKHHYAPVIIRFCCSCKFILGWWTAITVTTQKTHPSQTLLATHNLNSRLSTQCLQTASCVFLLSWCLRKTSLTGHTQETRCFRGLNQSAAQENSLLRHKQVTIFMWSQVSFTYTEPWIKKKVVYKALYNHWRTPFPF